MHILDGKKLNQEISEELKLEISKIKNEDKVDLCLVILQIGDSPASNIYIKNKIIMADKLGVKCEQIKFPYEVTQDEVAIKIKELNSNPDVTGIILQLPISEHLNKNKVINLIDVEKDVDGLGEVNLAKLVNNQGDGLVPATSLGITTLLKHNGIEIAGQNVVVIGRSVLVGKSLALHLLNHNATVTVCHSHTKKLTEIAREADIIISATGSHGLINKDLIRENQILVDVGISTIDNRMVGDSNLSSEELDKLKSFSPVPGGVGPMTVVSLFTNLIKAYGLQK